MGFLCGHPKAISSLFEDYDVLRWQGLNGADVFEPYCLHLLLKLVHRHLMHFLDRKLGIFLTVLDEHHPSTRLQRLTDLGHHFIRLGEFVIDIHHWYRVHAAGG